MTDMRMDERTIWVQQAWDDATEERLMNMGRARLEHVDAVVERLMDDAKTLSEMTDWRGEAYQGLARIWWRVAMTIPSKQYLSMVEAIKRSGWHVPALNFDAR